MKRVALLGAGGQLGRDLHRHLEASGDFDVEAFDRRAADCTQLEQVRTALRQTSPQVVVNCAAYVRVDDAERNAEEAFRVNAVGARNVAEPCAELGALCVQISTDFVFDGEKGSAYTERDSPHPINVYGVSKLAGEHLVELAAPRHLIVRTAGLYGPTPSRAKGNVVETILAKAARGEHIEVVEDIRTSPTLTSDLAQALVALLRADAVGIIHVANAGECTWYEFACRAIAAFPDARVSAVPSADRPARRPRNTSLAAVRLREEFGIEMRPWQQALADYLRRCADLRAQPPA